MEQRGGRDGGRQRQAGRPHIKAASILPGAGEEGRTPGGAPPPRALGSHQGRWVGGIPAVCSREWRPFGSGSGCSHHGTGPHKGDLSLSPLSATAGVAGRRESSSAERRGCVTHRPPPPPSPPAALLLPPPSGGSCGSRAPAACRAPRRRRLLPLPLFQRRDTGAPASPRPAPPRRPRGPAAAWAGAASRALPAFAALDPIIPPAGRVGGARPQVGRPPAVPESPQLTWRPRWSRGRLHAELSRTEPVWQPRAGLGKRLVFPLLPLRPRPSAGF